MCSIKPFVHLLFVFWKTMLGSFYSNHIPLDILVPLVLYFVVLEDLLMRKQQFHFGYHEKILIDQWHIQNVGGLIGSMVGIMVIAIIYEGLKYVREHLSKHNARSSVQTTILSQMHCVQTILHLIQLTLSYLLMLIFMTYNAWLCIAVVLGSTIGYFLVGWKRTGIVDTTEHCQ